MSHIQNILQATTKAFLLSAGLTITLISCGGGGGGGSTPATIQYTGEESPADVDDSNTQTFTAAIIDGGQDSQENSGNFTLFGISSSNSTSKNKQHSMLANLVQQVKTNIENKDIGNSNLLSGITEIIEGNCLGNEGSFTSTFDQTANEINASITYNNYCEEFFGVTTTTNGSLTASVVFSDSSLATITSFSMNTPRLSITVVDSNIPETYTNEFSGTASVTFTANGDIDSMMISMNFVEDGKTYKLENLSYATSGVDISISGTIFHPDHGYVSFATTEPFILYNDELCDGTLAVTGVNSNFTITADATCSSFTYTGTNNLGGGFANSFTELVN